VQFGGICEQARQDPGLDPTGRVCELAGRAEEVQDMTRKIYASLLVQTAEDFSGEDLDSQLELALAPIRATPLAEDFMGVFRCQVNRYRTEGNEDLSPYFDELLLDPPRCR
jgi:hypothetical protein